jgi:hypothetical protein
MKLKRTLLFPIRCVYYAQNKLILVSWHYPGATFHKLLMCSVPLFVSFAIKEPTWDLVRQSFLLIPLSLQFCSVSSSIHILALEQNNYHPE